MKSSVKSKTLLDLLGLPVDSDADADVDETGVVVVVALLGCVELRPEIVFRRSRSRPAPELSLSSTSTSKAHLLFLLPVLEVALVLVPAFVLELDGRRVDDDANADAFPCALI